MSRLSIAAALCPPLLCAPLIAAGTTASAQTPAFESGTPVPAPTAEQQEAIRRLPDTIHDKLTAQGFSEVTVVPGSFIVSARDREGKPMMMLIGPSSVQVLTMAPPGAPSGEDESIAQGPMDDDHDTSLDQLGRGEVIQQ